MTQDWDGHGPHPDFVFADPSSVTPNVRTLRVFDPWWGSRNLATQNRWCEVPAAARVSWLSLANEGTNVEEASNLPRRGQP